MFYRTNFLSKEVDCPPRSKWILMQLELSSNLDRGSGWLIQTDVRISLKDRNFPKGVYLSGGGHFAIRRFEPTASIGSFGGVNINL